MLIGVLTDGPQQSAGEHVEVNRFGHRFAVMSDGGGEDFGPAVIVGPDADLRFVIVLASGGSEWCGGVEDFCGVVEFAFGYDEAFSEARHDGVCRLQVVDGIRVMRAVSGGLHPAEFEPAVVSDAVAVHGAVDEDGGDALLVWSQDAIDKVAVFHVGKAFIVNDDVEAIGPPGIVVEGDFGVG